MFIVLLRFSSEKSRAPSLMEAHKAWLEQGLSDGVFLLSGSLKPGLGGVILARNTSLAELQHRVDADPFVEHGVVKAEILEVAPSRAAESLQFLIA